MNYPCVLGSPAPAGIDPGRRRWFQETSRLPRSRGDRPRRPADRPARRRAPPLPRGSTLRAAAVKAGMVGSPAPAGIDPHTPDAARRCRRLPRSRGDRPADGEVDGVDAMAPPLPRGSTPDRTGGSVLPVGSPAPAGIDPTPVEGETALRRLPRSRGDRPGAADDTAAVQAAPPLPRGSTRRRGALHSVCHGSPAPAGIDPAGSGALRRSTRLPRSRGDRPPLRVFGIYAVQAPPLPRGSTPRQVRNPAGHPGSPAPAGIDPSAAAASRYSAGLPRSRGDRPLSSSTRIADMKAPPLPRGSTLPAPLFRHDRLGSPAPAGIDRCARYVVSP